MANLVHKTRVTLPGEKALMIGDSMQNCYTYECANTFYYYMFLALTNISWKSGKPMSFHITATSY